MKKLIAIALTVALVIAAFAVVAPVGAAPPTNPVVYETSLVPQLQNVLDVGSYASVTLEEGEVKVYADGGYKVEIKGLELDGAPFTGELGVVLWDRIIGQAAAVATITLDEGEGTREMEADSIYQGEYTEFFVQVNDSGVACLLVSGFSIE